MSLYFFNSFKKIFKNKLDKINLRHKKSKKFELLRIFYLLFNTI